MAGPSDAGRRSHIRAVNRLLATILALFALTIAAVFIVADNGHRIVVTSQRQGCHGFDKAVLVPLLNILRSDELANEVIAGDPTQSPQTRNTRAREAQIEALGLYAMDRHLDRHSVAALNATDQQIVRSLGTQGYDCNRAYPAVSLLQFSG